jgi:putative spermidine/putrescine transport system permease protein
MAATTAHVPAPAPSFLRRVSTYFYRRPRLSLFMTLALPMFWLVIVYLGSLLALVVQSFYGVDSFTGQVTNQLTLDNYRLLLQPANIDIIVRTVTMAALVTVAAVPLAYPLAYYMARYASPRMKMILYVLILLPLWSSYLVRVYAWKLILAKEGIVSWFAVQTGTSGLLDAFLQIPGVGGTSLALSNFGIFIAFVYVWLPYMIISIEAALERVPKSLLEASGDLGAKPGTTFRQVIWPLAFPGVVAGSIFTFALTLGDFVVPTVLGNSQYFIGQAVLTLQSTSGNLPLAAALTVVPMLIMGVYLWFAKRLGAFDAL